MRPFFAGLLLVVAVLLLPLADIGIWVQRQLVPTDAFLDVTTEVLGEPEVQQALAERITEELVAREPRLGSNQGILTPAIRQAVDSAAFDQVLRASLGTMHEQLTGGEDVLALDLDSALPVVRSQVEGVNASVAQQIPTDLAPITVLERDEAPALWKAVELTRQASWLLPLLT